MEPSLQGLRQGVVSKEANCLLFYSEILLLTLLKEQRMLVQSCANYSGLNENRYGQFEHIKTIGVC